MIRFIDLGKQIGLDEEWQREFAFFDTTCNKFIESGGEQVWESWDDFITSGMVARSLADRIKPLCPDWVFKKGDER